MIFAFIIITDFYFIVLSEGKLTYDTTTPDQDTPINSDENELSQALLLIDVLKSGYLKLLRQSSEVARNVTEEVEQSTCAMTSGSVGQENETTISTLSTPNRTTATLVKSIVSHANRHPAFNKSLAPWISPRLHATPMFPWRWSDPGNTRTHNNTPLYDTARLPPQQRPWRRFFPDYYFYDVHPPRRRFYNNPRIRLLATNKNPETLASTIRTKGVPMTAKTDGSSKSTTSRKPTAASSKATSKSRTTNNRNLAAPQRTSKGRKAIDTFPENSAAFMIEAKNPVEAEVAFELLKEFKLVNVTPKAKIRKTTEDYTSTE